jgi:hypothetical protein
VLTGNRKWETIPLTGDSFVSKKGALPNGAYLIRPTYKYPQNRILHQAADARRNEKIRSKYILVARWRHPCRQRFFHCAWHLLLVTKI